MAVAVHDLRGWTRDRHRTVDDVPYGGGPGMVMMAEPLARAVVERAECRKCGFRFDEDKITKPGKCPECRETWIREPRVGLERTDA